MKALIKKMLGRDRLPQAALDEARRDAAGLPAEDPGTDQVLPAIMQWLCRAQDMSASHDGGVARDYSLIKGWATSYPETTGYIIPTFFEYARRTGQAEYRERALRMTDWLVSIQLPDGGFQGGKIDSQPVVPVTFNTGQILMGLAAAQAETGRYLSPMRRAADWLVQTQDPDGAWRKHESPFAASGDKQYETHVAWGLFEAERVDPGRGYLQAGLRNVQWAIKDLPANGWFQRCSLSQSAHPITHTLGYALRGVIEAHRLAPDPLLLDAALRTADGLHGALRDDGFLPGMLDSNWKGSVHWACLTGSAQVASCWTLLAHLSGRTSFLECAARVNRFLRRTVRLYGAPGQVGAIKGSFPVDGDYCTFEHPNWAAKFVADSLMQERTSAGAFQTHDSR
jgi:Prenyltransferase and squalene oxidase repeat